jgi:hypothetical protein
MWVAGAGVLGREMGCIGFAGDRLSRENRRRRRDGASLPNPKGTAIVHESDRSVHAGTVAVRSTAKGA